MIVMGYGMMYNSWRQPNLWYYRDSENNFVFVAERAIKSGEELFIDYGCDWWGSRESKVGLGYEETKAKGSSIGCSDSAIAEPAYMQL